MQTKSKDIVEVNDDSKQQIPKQTPLTQTGASKGKKAHKKDASDLNGKKQKRITNYFNANSLSSVREAPPDPKQIKLNQLRQQLNKKQETLLSIRMQKDSIQNKYGTLYRDNKNYKQKAKEIIIKTLSEQASIFRNDRQKIDIKMGYYIKNLSEYVIGDDILKIKKQIFEKEDEYKKIEVQLKKCKSDEQKDRMKFAIQYIKKQIAKKQEQLSKKQKQATVYQVKLKIAEKEKTCTFASSNWPIIKDLKGNQRYLTLWLLGKGGFGQVYKCYDLQTNQYVSLKINKIYASNQDSQNVLKHVERQIKVHQELKHSNIVQIKQVLQVSSKRVIFILQYCDGPQLSLYIKQKKCIEEKDAKMIMYQIFSALNYLSQRDQKIIHYDLKPSNIMFHKGVVKLLDFGLCKQMESGDSRIELTSQGTGTYWYLPPETFLQETAIISPKVDVWSAGVIFFQMLYGKRPFADQYHPSVIFGKNMIAQSAKNFKFPSDNPNKYKISQETKDFILQCLRSDQQQRLSVKQALNHPYFKS